MGHGANHIKVVTLHHQKTANPQHGFQEIPAVFLYYKSKRGKSVKEEIFVKILIG